MKPTFLSQRKTLDRHEPVDRYDQRLARNATPENMEGEFILYWVQSARRLRRNLALDYAIEMANRLRLPVVAYESIRSDYPEANDRIHTFVLEGILANRQDAERRGVHYHFYLPATSAEAKGVLRTLALRARHVVTDEYPTFILREQTEKFVQRSPVAVTTVDTNGLLPMRVAGREQYSARFFRSIVHRSLADHWRRFDEPVCAMRFAGSIDLPEWSDGDVAPAVSRCAIDHSVVPVRLEGGRQAGLLRLDTFLKKGLHGYAEGRNRSMGFTSRLSPYLHFGHLGIHDVAERVLDSDAPAEDIESFLEEAVVRRELSFNLCFYRQDHGSLVVLPDWAKRTLAKHEGDRRKPLYSDEELASASTYDEVWNLAQRQLRETGTIHGYLRMIWGKRIMEWKPTMEEAHATMLRLHDRYAIDGRDPNTHAGVLWCFGKHDRAWGPERPIYGTVRYMSSEAAKRKVRLAEVEEAVASAIASRASKNVGKKKVVKRA